MKHFRPKDFLFFVLTIASFHGLVTSADAQPGSMFGKNKVQYRDFRWQYIQSPHFDVYFYQGGKDIAEFTAEEAERSLISIQRTMNYDITSRIAILVYDGHNDFQQTNAVGEFLPEGVGGVTELFKNRVVLPFEGSYDLFRHVIHHELVHAVANEMFTGGNYQTLLTGGGMQIPSWMNEGLAEYESLRGLDIETDMYMRDATLNQNVPPLGNLGGYIQYRVGQTMYWYIATKYGPEKVGELLHRIKTSRDVERGFRSTFGLTVKEFNDKFQKALQVYYYPDIAKYKEPTEFAEAIADHKKLDNYINASPEVSPAGDLLAYISDRHDYYDIYVQSISRPNDVKRVLSGGGARSGFEELHLLTPGMSWSPDGRRLAVAAKAGARDAITLLDVKSGDEQRLPNFDLDGIHELDWSPDGTKLALVGIKNGQSDIYTYDFASQKLTNLTNDLFGDLQPKWTADSRSIIFTSARANYLTPGEYPASRLIDFNFLLEDKIKSKDLYKLTLSEEGASATISRLTATDGWDEFSPAVGKNDGVLYYVSNKNGINNVWTSDLDGNGGRPLTNSLSKIEQLSVSNDGSKLAFTTIHDGGYDLYLMRNPKDEHIDSLPMTEFRKSQLPGVASRLDSVSSNNFGDTTKSVGDVKIDLNDYVFTNNPEIDRSLGRYAPATSVQTVTGNKDTVGHYIVRDYRTVFSPDVILGSAGYTGYYGLQATTQMLFSDQLGNHQIFFATNLVLDLKNSDYILAYYDLENRVNFGLQGFHTAQFIRVPVSVQDQSIATGRFTQYGLTGLASYPFNRFNRLDFGLNGIVLEKDLLDVNVDVRRKYALFPQVAYVHDNTIWSYFYPKGGTRYNASVSFAPRFGNSWLGFATPALDFRHYIRLTDNISIATRFAGAASFGPTPQKFFLGGIDGWLNRFFSQQSFPLYEPEDFAFFTAGRPLRGYAFNERIGTKYGLANIELRYPFPVFVAGFPISFFGSSFIDAGTAWSHSVYLFQKTKDNRIITKDLLISAGTGVRTYLFGFYAHFDIAWKTNLDAWSHPIFLFSVGEDF